MANCVECGAKLPFLLGLLDSGQCENCVAKQQREERAKQQEEKAKNFEEKKNNFIKVQNKSQQKIQLDNHHSNTTIIGLNIPFQELVVFLIKFSFALIPALFVVLLVLKIISIILNNVF